MRTSSPLLRALTGRLACAVAASAAASFAARGETLDEAFQAALQNDQSLAAEHQRGAAEDAQLSAARALRMPSLSATGVYYHLDSAPTALIDIPPLAQFSAALIPEESVAYSVVATMPLFTSGRISKGIEAAQASVRAERQHAAGATQDVRLAVAENYVAVLRARRLLRLADSSVETLKLHAADVVNLREQGLAALNEELAAKVALANATQDRLRVQNALDLAQAAYNRQVGRPLDAVVQLDDLQAPSASPPLAELVARALSARSELAELDGKHGALKAQAVSVRAQQLPALSLSGGRYSLRDPNLADDTFWAVGVGFKWDLFDGGRSRAQARVLEHQASAVEDTKHDAESLIRLQVQQNWLALSEALQRIAVMQQAGAQADENLRVVRDRYTSGVGTNSEVLDAETLRVRSESNYYNAVYDSVLAQLRLRRATAEL